MATNSPSLSMGLWVYGLWAVAIGSASPIGRDVTNWSTHVLVPARQQLQAKVASSWTELKSVIAGAPSDSTSIIDLDASFLSNYDSQIEIDGKSITINGNGAVLDAGKKGRLFALLSATLTLHSVTLQNGAEASVGAIRADSSAVNIYNSILQNNEASGVGAIFADSSSVVSIYNSTLQDNKAEVDGGAIGASSSTVNIYNSTLQNNEALFGGAIAAGSSTVNIYNSTLQRNTALQGGAIGALESSTINIHGSTLQSNIANRACHAGGSNAGQACSYNSDCPGSSCVGGQGKDVYKYNDSSVVFTGCTAGSTVQFTANMTDCCSVPKPFPGRCGATPGPAPGPAPELSAPEVAGISIGAVAMLGVAGAGVFMLKKRSAGGAQEALLEANDTTEQEQQPAFDPYTGEPLNAAAHEARGTGGDVETL